MRSLSCKTSRFVVLAVLLLFIADSNALRAQRAATDPANVTVDPSWYGNLRYRSLGFSRGGRATAVAGVASEPLTYYFGSTGGGVWKTTDAGLSWANISDGFFEAGSIGAVAVAPSDPNVIYAGTGSACIRGNVSIGVGMYRSVDAGKTWTHIGLRDAGFIGKIAVHPSNPDLVYVAVLGNIFGNTAERGVFRSKDGGATWQKVLFVNDKTGAVDISINPKNPRVVYAGFWTVERKPWTIDSGSREGGVYQTTDGGDTWKRATNGLPRGMVGKTGVSVSPANPERVWALIEADNDEGGVYRSDNGGQSWQRLNRQRNLQQRAWYYMHIHADPRDPETVYALNTGFYKSTDGGRTFQGMGTPHGDNHDLWISSADNQKMINSNDGGANVSLNGGRSWSEQHNQPTAEFYRVTVDTRWPYRVYGAQQDNSTASVSSAGGGFGGGGGASFYAVGGGESGHIAVDPRKPNIVYAGSYGGLISRVDTDSGLSENIRTYPEEQTGQRAADMKYRFQWNAPIRLSPHNPDVVYHTSQHVHRSMDQGKSWEIISPDLTRNDRTRQDYSGGKGITRDSTGVEVFDVIFAFEESPKVKGLLWAGSDDGVVHVSRDDGKNWTNITPKDMPELGCVNVIDLSAHDPGRAHIAVYKYRQNDFAPYIFQTNDYGRTWRRLTDGRNGIPANHFVRVVREDPERKGLLYAGTEFGMYISFDDGAHWQPFQLNLPVTPITDLMVHKKDLIVATQGRAFWAIDDVSPLQQITDQVRATTSHLFKPREAYRAGGGQATFFYYFKEQARQPVRVDILDAKGGTVATFTGRPGGLAQPQGPPGGPFGGGGGGGFGGGGGQQNVPIATGLNRFSWNMRFPAIFQIPQGTVMWGGGGAGPKVVPGIYTVKVTSGDWTQSQTFEVKGDPRLNTSIVDYEEQLRLSREVGGKVKEIYDTLATLRDVKQQLTQIGERMTRSGYGDEASKAATDLNERLKELEGELTQLQGEGGQDALNFPGRMDNQWVALYNFIAGPETRPTKGSYARYEDLKPGRDRLLGQIRSAMDAEVSRFNELVKGKGVGPVIMRK